MNCPYESHNRILILDASSSRFKLIEDSPGLGRRSAPQKNSLAPVGTRVGCPDPDFGPGRSGIVSSSFLRPIAAGNEALHGYNSWNRDPFRDGAHSRRNMQDGISRASGWPLRR